MSPHILIKKVLKEWICRSADLPKEFSLRFLEYVHELFKYLIRRSENTWMVRTNSATSPVFEVDLHFLANHRADCVT